MTDRPTLLQACEDPALFNFPLWPKQRELIASIGLARLLIWCLGRRSGKTTIAALVCLHNLLFRPDLDALVRPGERRYAVVVATNQQQARVLLKAALSIIEASPILLDQVLSISDDEIVFRNNTVLRAFPCSSRGGRGYPISCLILDEAAHFLNSEGYQDATQVFTALHPSTAQFGELATVIVSSTPYGTGGFFADMHRKSEAGELAGAMALRVPTWEMNPTIEQGFLDTERARDVDNFRGEYGAEFVGSGGAFLDFSRFEVAERGELSPDECVEWTAGLDPAFSRDPFGLALIGRDPENREIRRLGLVRGFTPSVTPKSFEDRRSVEDELLSQVAAVCKQYRITRAVTDQYAAPAVVAYFSRIGIPLSTIPMSASSKTAAYTELKARLYDGSLEIFDHPDLIAELSRLRTRFTAGAAAVENPRIGGSHGDMAQAVALATLALRGQYGGGSRGFRSGGLDLGGPEGSVRGNARGER